MKKNNKSSKLVTFIALILTVALACVMVGSAVLAEERGSGVAGDTNPAIMVAAKTETSVVGVQTNRTSWSRSSGEVKQPVSQGSGVVIQAGYVLTNYHVVEDGTDYEVLLPSGEYIPAQLVGSDASTDLAVLKVDTSALTPVEVGSSSDLVVGSTVIAIGNPGGEVLANTVTAGIVSALERTSVNSTNTTRAISYIQHDAAINNGNSGGGLFNVNGELVGINTLKYRGSVFNSVSFEGLGFAIPVDTAYPIAMDLIEHGKVLRPQMGVTVTTVDGPEDPIPSNPPASVCVASVTEGGPAEAAGFKQYDFITHIDGVRVKSLQELTTQLDQHKEGDVVEITVVRYSDPTRLSVGGTSGSTEGSDGNGGNYYNPFGGYFGDFFGNYGGNYGDNYGDYYGRSGNTNVSSTYETLKLSVTLQILE